MLHLELLYNTGTVVFVSVACIIAEYRTVYDSIIRICRNVFTLIKRKTV
jgi:hypothetical protein